MVKFCWCKKEANEVANCLAEECYTSKSSCFWDNSAPDFISSLIVNEDLKWSKPVHGFTKLNVDASYNEDSASCATGAVLGDEGGHFIAAAT